MNCSLYSSLYMGKRRGRSPPLWLTGRRRDLFQNTFLRLLKCYCAVDQPNMGERLWIVAELLSGLWIELLRVQT